jgi:ATP-dependent RNA helicase DDX23/PRP28
VYLLNENQKNDELGKILKGLPGPIIVFVNTREKCKKIVNIIEIKYHRSCAEYHGGKSQENRQAIIQNFRNSKFEILVATDLGGRGLDIKGVSAAISYDAPKNIS